ncbi:hypothetical protein [Nocardiopsis synnemataformans]|uniref:hypothetical protein n=1 Tax=Nocardiopsis synnemataformans TaxID=61305 RepID=UPI003EBC94DC
MTASPNRTVWQQIYGQRADRPGLILARAYAMAQAGRWNQMRSYLVWELDQPVYGDPSMAEVFRLRNAVAHADDLTGFVYGHMVSARLRHGRGHLEEATARVGWLLELIPESHPEHATVLDVYRQLTTQGSC